MAFSIHLLNMFSRDVFIDVIELRLKIENKLKFNLEKHIISDMKQERKHI